MARSISLDRVLRLGIAVTWQEAVAVAQHFTQRVGPSEVALGLDNCLLSTSGLIEVAGTSTAPFVGNPAATALSALLDRARAPRELVSLVQKFADAGPAQGDIATELQFFARPDAAAAIGTLATRALAAASEVDQQGELDRLRAQAVTLPSPPAKARTAPMSGRLVMAAAALVLFTVAAVMTIAAMRTRGTLLTGNEDVSQRAADTSPVRRVTARLEALVDKGLTSLGFAPADSIAAANVPQSSPVEKPPSRRTPMQANRATVPTTPMFVLMLPQAIEPSTDAQNVGDTVDAESHTPMDEGGEAASQPPVLRWPQLPKDPASVPLDASAPYLELLINEAGTVDKVRLHSRESSFHERMLVSAAKAWVFHPALQDGRPVKYLLKVPIVSQ